MNRKFLQLSQLLRVPKHFIFISAASTWQLFGCFTWQLLEAKMLLPGSCLDVLRGSCLRLRYFYLAADWMFYVAAAGG